MIKASLASLACALLSTKLPVAFAFPLLLVLPAAEVAYMFVHHGLALDLYGAELLPFYSIEVLGYFVTVNFLIDGQVGV